MREEGRPARLRRGDGGHRPRRGRPVGPRRAAAAPAPGAPPGRGGGAPRRGPAGIVGLGEQRALDAAVAAYARALTGTGGGAGEPAALDYCLARGLTRRLIAEESVGFCSGDALLPALAERGIAPYHAWNVGLLAYDRVAGRYREKQAGRLIFPIRRDAGGWGWLTGRWLGPERVVDAAADESRRVPKYLHLPGPKPLLGWRECRGQAVVLLVEGIVCFLLLRGWGYPTVCALGTEIDGVAAARLRSFPKTVLIGDNDAAGRAMVERLRATIYADRATVRFQFEDGVKDVADLAALGRGRERFHARLLLSLRAAA